MWALIIAMLSTPLYVWLLLRLNERRNTAAALVMMLVFVGGVLPLALMMASLTREASVFYDHINSGDWNPAQYLRGLFDALPGWIASLLARFGVADFDNLQSQLTHVLTQGSRFIATQAFGIGMNTLAFVASLGVTLYLAFFLVRDGEQLSRMVKAALPVPERFKKELVDNDRAP